MSTAEDRMGRGILIGLIILALGAVVVGGILGALVWLTLKAVGLL